MKDQEPTWGECNIRRLTGETDAQISAQLLEALNSQNGFAYTPGSSNLVREAAVRLAKDLPGEKELRTAFAAWIETQGNGEISALDVCDPDDLEKMFDDWKLALLRRGGAWPIGKEKT